MIRRFWHWLAGHKYVEHSTKSFAPTGEGQWAFDDVTRWIAYGFTDIDFFCSCGARKRHRIVGQRDTKTDTEIAELRRIVKL